jgi:hypothetical protein
MIKKSEHGINKNHQIIIKLLLLVLINAFLLRNKLIEAYEFQLLDIDDKIFITYAVITLILCINLETELIQLKNMYMVNFIYMVLMIYVIFYNMILVNTTGNTKIILNYIKILITFLSFLIFVWMLKDIVLNNENSMLINIISYDSQNDTNNVKRNNQLFSLLLNILIIFYIFCLTLYMINNLSL